MIQRIEQWRDGVMLGVEEVELPDPVQQPLPADGVIATLNAVLGLWTLQDAANASGYTEDQLIAEAQAWAAAEGDQP